MSGRGVVYISVEYDGTEVSSNIELEECTIENLSIRSYDLLGKIIESVKSVDSEAS